MTIPYRIYLSIFHQRSSNLDLERGTKMRTNFTNALRIEIMVIQAFNAIGSSLLAAPGSIETWDLISGEKHGGHEVWVVWLMDLYEQSTYTHKGRDKQQSIRVFSIISINILYQQACRKRSVNAFCMNLSSMYKQSKISTATNILFIIDPPRVN